MPAEVVLGIIDILLLPLAAFVPLLIAIRIPRRIVRGTALLLSLVLFTHSLFHFTAGVLGEIFVAAVILQPLSIILLIIFGILLDKSGL